MSSPEFVVDNLLCSVANRRPSMADSDLREFIRAVYSPDVIAHSRTILTDLVQPDSLPDANEDDMMAILQMLDSYADRLPTFAATSFPELDINCNNSSFVMFQKVLQEVASVKQMIQELKGGQSSDISESGIQTDSYSDQPPSLNGEVGISPPAIKQESTPLEDGCDKKEHSVSPTTPKRAKFALENAVARIKANIKQEESPPVSAMTNADSQPSKNGQNGGSSRRRPSSSNHYPPSEDDEISQQKMLKIDFSPGSNSVNSGGESPVPVSPGSNSGNPDDDCYPEDAGVYSDDDQGTPDSPVKLPTTQQHMPSIFPPSLSSLYAQGILGHGGHGQLLPTQMLYAAAMAAAQQQHLMRSKSVSSFTTTPPVVNVGNGYSEGELDKLNGEGEWFLWLSFVFVSTQCFRFVPHISAYV